MQKEDIQDIKTVKNIAYKEERALFLSDGLNVCDCEFSDGESPLKESKNIQLDSCIFRWKYPLWYAKHIFLENSILEIGARAGIWYTEDIKVVNCNIIAPKAFRRTNNIVLENITMPNAEETLWNCSNVNIKNLTANGAYFAMNTSNIRCENVKILGGYCFDGVENGEFINVDLDTKDAFWNSKNVTVRNSNIKSEYIGWNSENLTFINCTIESLQGFCYIKNLRLENCKLINTTLAFEYSTVNAKIEGGVDSVLNPSGGRIEADYIDQLIIEQDKIDPSKTIIICKGKK